MRVNVLPPPPIAEVKQPEKAPDPPPKVEVQPEAPTPMPTPPSKDDGKRVKPRKIEAKKPEISDPPPPTKAPTAQSVDAKFQQVRREYDEFKRNFGGRLEPAWQEILHEAAMGRRDAQLDDRLNQLRGDMRRIKSDAR